MLQVQTLVFVPKSFCCDELSWENDLNFILRAYPVNCQAAVRQCNQRICCQNGYFSCCEAYKSFARKKRSCSHWLRELEQCQNGRKALFLCVLTPASLATNRAIGPCRRNQNIRQWAMVTILVRVERSLDRPYSLIRTHTVYHNLGWSFSSPFQEFKPQTPYTHARTLTLSRSLSKRESPPGHGLVCQLFSYQVSQHRLIVHVCHRHVMFL